MFVHFADNQGVQPSAEYIGLFCDASLDEGDAIIRADFAPTLGSSGSELFLQLDRYDAEALLASLQIAGLFDTEELSGKLRKLRDYTYSAETASKAFSGHSVRVPTSQEV